MGKRAFIAIAIFCVLLIFGIQSVETTVANPFFMYKYVDPPSGTIPPNILVINPQNNTAYSSSNICFNFIVNNAITPSTNQIGICEVNYTLQNQQKRLYVFPNWTQSNTADLTHPGLQQFNYSDTFSLADGNYTLLIYSNAIGFPGGSSPTLFYTNNSATIYFNVNTSTNPTPSAPEFTAKAENGSVVVTIKNQQPYVLNYRTLYSFYNIRYKNHLDVDNWTYLHNYLPQFVVLYPGIPDSRDALIPSDSQYTILNYTISFSPCTQADFQAQIVLYNLTYNAPSGENPTPAPQNYKYEYTLLETSDWSVTQTVAVPGSSSSASPTQQPTMEPSLTISPTPTAHSSYILEIIGTLAIVIVVGGLLVYFRKRRAR